MSRKTSIAISNSSNGGSCIGGRSPETGGRHGRRFRAARPASPKPACSLNSSCSSATTRNGGWSRFCSCWPSSASGFPLQHDGPSVVIPSSERAPRATAAMVRPGASACGLKKRQARHAVWGRAKAELELGHRKTTRQRPEGGTKVPKLELRNQEARAADGLKAGQRFPSWSFGTRIELELGETGARPARPASTVKLDRLDNLAEIVGNDDGPVGEGRAAHAPLAEHVVE